MSNISGSKEVKIDRIVKRRKEASLICGTYGKWLWLLRSRPDQIGHAAMRRGPPARIIAYCRRFVKPIDDKCAGKFLTSVYIIIPTPAKFYLPATSHLRSSLLCAPILDCFHQAIYWSRPSPSCYPSHSQAKQNPNSQSVYCRLAWYHAAGPLWWLLPKWPPSNPEYWHPRQRR